MNVIIKFEKKIEDFNIIGKSFNIYAINLYDRIKRLYGMSESGCTICNGTIAFNTNTKPNFWLIKTMLNIEHGFQNLVTISIDSEEKRLDEIW